jgi:N-acetylglucosamine kinase-like BadF-type ATPase
VSTLLAVDGGQTALRMAVVEGGSAVRVGEAPGFSHGSGDNALAIAAAVAEARETLGEIGAVERVCLGLTGAPGPPEPRARLAELIASRLDAATVWLGPDMVTAHAGALEGGPGVVVSAGTGAVVLGVAADATAHRADGLGFLLGDDGSGFAIGQAGVRAALRARELRGPATALEDAAMSFFGGLDHLPHRIHSSESAVRDLASFAPEVAAVARGGDELARAIWRDAANNLADTTAAVIRRTFPDAAAGSVPVSHSGRLFGVEDLLLEPFRTALAERSPAARHQPPRGDSLDGAARLVAGGLGRFAGLMHVTEGRGA